MVFGDIVVLEARDAVPADLRILESFDLKVEESALTGESEPVLKNSDVIDDSKNDIEESKIVLFYQGNIDEIELIKKAREKLTTYMVPNKVAKIEKMPYNANGKIDRKLLNKMHKESK